MYAPAGYVEEETDELPAWGGGSSPLPPEPPPHVPEIVWEPRQELSTITRQPMKRKLKTMTDRTSSDAIALDSDSDFDDDSKIPLRNPPKAAHASAPAKSSTPASRKPTPRLQACGEKQLDRCVMAARDNGPHVRVVVVSLSYRILNDAGADHVWRAEARDGSTYDLFPPYERNQSDLGESEFLGLFLSRTSDPGVGDQIAEQLVNDENAHIIIVDAGKGDVFARLAACVAALKVKFINKAQGAALYKQVLKPKGDVWKAVLAKAAKCRSDTELRGKMREHYVDHL